MVQPVVALLRAANPGAFLELDTLHPDNRWPERLVAALAEATTFIVFWSRHAAQSEAVNGEWKSALSAGKEVVSVLLDSTPVPDLLQACSSVEGKDLAAMRRYRAGRTTGLVCGLALLLAAAAIPLAAGKLNAWAPGAPALSRIGKNTPAAPATNSPGATPSPAAAANADRENRLPELLSKGRQLRESGDSTAAVAQFQEASTLDEKNPVPFVELAVTEEAMGLTRESLDHWRKVHQLGSSAGLYFSLAEAKLKAANALTAPGDTATAPEEAPDLTAPVEGIATGSVLGLLPVTREDQLDGKSAARFLLHIPVKVRPKARIDVHELIIHVLFYELVDGRRIEETAANVKSHWLNPPADWVGSETEQLEVEYQLPKPPTAADVIVDRKYYGYIIRLYYQELLQATVAEPASLGKLHPAPPTVTGEPAKPPAPKATPAPLPQGAFHQSAPVGLSAPPAAATATPSPSLPPDEIPTPTLVPAAANTAAATSLPLPWILSSVLLGCLAVASFVGSRVAGRRQRQFDNMIIELAARRLAASLGEPLAEEFVIFEELPDDSAPATGDDLTPAPDSIESEPAVVSSEEAAEVIDLGGQPSEDSTSKTTNDDEAETPPKSPPQDPA